MPAELGRNRPSEFEAASVLQLWTYAWASPLIYAAMHQELDEEHLWTLRKEDGVAAASGRLQAAIAEEQQLPAAQQRWFRMVLRAFRHNLRRCLGYYALFLTMSVLGSSVLLRQLLKLLEDGVKDGAESTLAGLTLTDRQWEGLGLALAFFLVEAGKSMFVGQAWLWGASGGVRAQSAMRMAVYDQLLGLRDAQVAPGLVTNMVAGDAQRLQEAGQFGMFFVAAPVTFLVVVVVSTIIAGWSVLLGFVAMFCLLPLQLRVGRAIGRFRGRSVRLTDQRIRMMSEILGAIKLIKMYAWEDSFAERVAHVRLREKSLLAQAAYVKVYNGVISFLIPPIITLCMFSAYVAVEGEMMPPSDAFTLLSLSQVLLFPSMIVPMAARNIGESKVGLQRLRGFLSVPRVGGGAVELAPLSKSAAAAVEFEQATFRWPAVSEDKGSEFRLAEWTLRLPAGALVGVVGPVGAGKSSLLAGALLGQMERVSGSAVLRGSVAYAAQLPWIFNGTVRDNVLFGQPLDDAWYQRVVEACALLADLEMLPAGDQTEVGERGMTLSGGQKARIALARAVYARSDVLLLDDPLSAVDVHVGRHLFDRCLAGDVTAGRTRVLVTHQVQFLPRCDYVVVLEAGRVAAAGTYDEVRSQVERLDQGEYSSAAGDVDEGETVAAAAKSKPAGAGAKLVLSEERGAPSVTMGTVLRYYQASGSKWYAGWVLLAFVLAQVLRTGTDWWLSQWAGATFDGKSQGWYIAVYASLTASLIVVGIGRGRMFVAYSLRAASALHDKTFAVMLRSKMQFFDSTPSGRVLNRFSGDMDVLDVKLPDSADILLKFMTAAALALLLVAVIVPPMLAVYVPLGLIFARTKSVFVPAVRGMKRLDSISKSPLLSHLQATIQGLVTIRAFGREDAYRARFAELVDRAARALLAHYVCNRWLATRLDLLSTGIVGGTAVLGLVADVSPELAGLSIVTSMMVAMTLQFTVRVYSEVSAFHTSVERLLHFQSHTPAEAPSRVPMQDLTLGEWPTRGRVAFDGVSARYREGLPLVLRDVSFEVRPQERVGIVGRTGSGKSTATLCLFRLLELAGGRIVIDGVDIARLGLSRLRRALAIVPQDPVMFEGTLRSNLDPFGESDDAQLWDALEQVHLRPFVESLDNGLDAGVAAGGANLSVGQRQLVCFGRALLRRSQVLVMDEATAAVDRETDALIQATVREAFAHTTCIVIAHRLDTIIDSDRILVLDEGRLVENGPPQELIAKGGVLAEMVSAAG